MKSFCISLEKNRPNWKGIQNYFFENGITDVSMVSAYNGKDIGRFFETKDTGVLKPNEKTLLELEGGVEKLVSTWSLYHLYNNTPRRAHAQLTSWGAVGCSLSHISIWKKMVDDNIDKALIFEDDVFFRPEFKERLNYILSNLPLDGDVILLDCTENFKPANFNSMFDRVLGPFFGTHAYVMTNEGARKLLPYVYPIEIQIDSFMGFSASINRIKIYTTNNLCGQKMHNSSIQTIPCFICDINENKIKYGFTTLLLIIFFIVIILLIRFSKNI